MPTETLPGPDGEPCATYVRTVREGAPMADYLVVAAGVDHAVVVAALLAGRPGWLVGTEDLALGEALERAGSRRRRLAHTYSLDLRAGPRALPRRSSVATIEPFSTLTDDLVTASEAAYPPGHPDHLGAATRRGLERLMSGEEVGPLLPCSRVAVIGGRHVGAAIVNDAGGTPPNGGPWLAEVFRAPGDETRGVGAALLAATIEAARGDGLATIGLAVSDGNPARRLYEAFGFAHSGSAMSVWLPLKGRAGSPA